MLNFWAHEVTNTSSSQKLSQNWRFSASCSLGLFASTEQEKEEEEEEGKSSSGLAELLFDKSSAQKHMNTVQMSSESI